MSIYVVEQGRRVATPVDALFPRRGVQAVVRTGRVEPIDGQTGSASSFALPGTPPRDNPARDKPARDKPIDAYREQVEPSHTRHKVLQAADLMSTHLYCLQPSDPLAQAWQLMQRHDFHHVLVTQADNMLIGILSDRDVWRALSIQPTEGELHGGAPVFESLRVVDMMTAKVVCAAADTSIRRLAEVMLLHGIDALPVTDDAQQLLGLVTRTDLLRALVLDAPVELWV